MSGNVAAVRWMERGGRPERPAVMAHRGGAALGPENSVDTMALAAAAGAAAVEVDLVETADGELLLLHDVFVGTGADRRWVRDLTATQVADVLGARPGTHRELLEACAQLGLGLYAEVKSAGRATLERFVADVVDRQMAELVCVASFRGDVVARVAELGAVDTSWLFWDPGADPLATAVDLGCTFVHPCFDLTPELVDMMAGAWTDRLWRAGLGVVSWNTVSPDLMRRMADAGVAAICTDDPRVVPDDLRPTVEAGPS